jgi:hypothetical protein
MCNISTVIRTITYSAWLQVSHVSRLMSSSVLRLVDAFAPCIPLPHYYSVSLLLHVIYLLSCACLFPLAILLAQTTYAGAAQSLNSYALFTLTRLVD